MSVREEGSSLQIRLLGGIRVGIPGRDITFPTKKAASLFAFLVFHHDRAFRRERLSGILWGDTQEERASRNLSTALWRVRKSLGGVDQLTLSSDREIVRLSFVPGQVDCDVERFRIGVDAADNHAGAERLRWLREAERLYSGDFLEGLDDEWCEDQRRILRSLFVDVLKKLARELKEAGNFREGVQYLQRLISIDPLDEDIHRDLMLMHYLVGDRHAAMRQYEIVKQVLAEELQVEPSTATTALYEQIRFQPQLAPAAMAGRAPEDELGRGPFRDIPMVGREDVFAQLVGWMNAAAGGMGRVCVVSGEIGIGKTKLVETLTAEARLRGFEVLRGECADVESSAPYQPLIQALWPRITSEQVSPDRSSFVVDVLVRTLHPEASPSGSKKAGPSTLDGALINEALINLLIQPADRSPALLVIEDLHNADRATESLITLLPGRISGSRLLVLVTVRSTEPRAGHLLAGLGANGAAVIELTGLGLMDMSELVRACMQCKSISEPVTKLVLERSSGIPLFAIELVDVLTAQNCIRVDPQGVARIEEGRLRAHLPELPSRIVEVIRRRISLLGRQASFVLCAAAVLGSDVRFDHLEELIGIPEDQFLESIEALVGARLLEETEKGLRFSHEAARVAALMSVSQARLQKLHRNAARLLEKVSPGRTEDIAWHWDRAGESEKALSYYELSADKARAVYANADAVRWYTRSLESFSSGDGRSPDDFRRRAGILIKRQEALDLLGRREEQAQDIEAILRIAGRLTDRRLLAEGNYLRSLVLSRMNSTDRALEAAEQARVLFRMVGDIQGEAKSIESTSNIYMLSREGRAAAQSLRRALALYKKTEDQSGEARALYQLGTLATLKGRNLEGLRHLDQAEGILRSINHQRPLASVLFQKGVTYRCLGQGARSEAYLASGIYMMKEIGDKVGEARGRSQLAYTHMTLGKLRESLRESLTALRIAREAGDLAAQKVFLNNAAYGPYRCLGDFGRAERCVLQAIKHAAESKGAENLAIYYDTMAAVLLDKGDCRGGLRWARQAMALYRRWQGHFHYVGAQVNLRLGTAYLLNRQHAQARPLLLRAVEAWKEDDFELQAHAVAALGQLHLETDDLKAALECARDLEKLMRRVDGLEQIQKIYWTQYRIYHRLGHGAAGRKALRKAYSTVMEQAAGLKGRLRERFVEGIPLHRQIIAEAIRLAGRSSLADGMRADQVGATGQFRNVSETGPSRDAARRIAERRYRVLDLIRHGDRNQAKLAFQLGVSPRTVRNDISVLRSEGLLPSGLPAGSPAE